MVGIIGNVQCFLRVFSSPLRTKQVKVQGVSVAAVGLVAKCSAVFELRAVGVSQWTWSDEGYCIGLGDGGLSSDAHSLFFLERVDIDELQSEIIFFVTEGVKSADEVVKSVW